MGVKTSFYRPRGVTAITILLIIFAALELIVGILAKPFYEGSITGPLYFASLLNQIQLPANSFLQQYITLTIYGNLFAAINALSMSNYFDLLIVAIMTFAGLHLFACVGLFYMRKWGYTLALIIGVINIVIVLSAVILPILVILIFNLFLGIAIIAYLLGKAKYEFQ